MNTVILCDKIPYIQKMWDELRTAMAKHAPFMLERMEWRFTNSGNQDTIFAEKWYGVSRMHWHFEATLGSDDVFCWTAYVDGGVAELYREGKPRGKFARGVDADTAVRYLITESHEKIAQVHYRLNQLRSFLPPDEGKGLRTYTEDDF